MQTDQIISKIKPILLKYGVTKSDLFGSFARGDNDSQSDIDLLVEVPRGTSLFDLAYLKDDLQNLLNKKVDVLTYNSINKRLKNYILETTVKVL